MTKLIPIPAWMEPIILQLSGGEYTSVEVMRQDIETTSKVDPSYIGIMNTMIGTIRALDEFGHIKRNQEKPLQDIKMGEIFKINPEQERYFTKDATNIKENNMYAVREFHGGSGRGSSWLGAPSQCRIDINVIVVPQLPEAISV